MEMAQKFIFLFLVGTTLLNFAIALAARIRTNYKDFTQLVLYWPTLFLTFLSAAVLSQNETQIAFSYFFQIIPTMFITKMLMDSRGLRFNLPFYSSIYSIAAIISLYLILYTDSGFTTSLLPVTFATALPLFPNAWDTLVAQRKESSWVEKGMGLTMLTGIVNHFNFAIFRLDEAAAWWGWGIAIIQYQCVSIFLPLMFNQRREDLERKNLKLALEKITGKNAFTNVEIDELYKNLEHQITLKEEFSSELKKTNSYLEAEREMNEILIKTISHDIANPLTVINAYASMIESGRIPPEDFKKTMVKISFSIDSALNMVQRIRNAILTRNQASFVKINDVPLDRVINNLISQFEPKLYDKEIKVIYKNEDLKDTIVRAEEHTLSEHVFSNVLSNAIKFSHQGSQITISLEDLGDEIAVHFTDQGIGIKNDRLDRHLLSSTQGTQGETGSGFGIMVMGYFLQQFGARYKVNSEGENKGTTVSIHLKKSYVSIPKVSQDLFSDSILQ